MNKSRQNTVDLFHGEYYQLLLLALGIFDLSNIAGCIFLCCFYPYFLVFLVFFFRPLKVGLLNENGSCEFIIYDTFD